MPPEALVADWMPAVAPRPHLTVSDWSDVRRRLPQRSASQGGRWRTDTAPYLRGIMDSVHEAGVKKIALRKCHQVGGSEALHNIVGYHIEHDACPILFVHPTVDVAEEWSKERLTDMLDGTPELSATILENDSTLLLKMFEGGFLALGGANTPNTFARRAVRLAIGDDVDRFPPVVGDEGDPADLLVNRTTSFYDGLTIFVSTPTLKGGRIDTLYERSDQRKFFVPCLACGREDWIAWSDPKHWSVVFEDRDPDTARLACPDLEYGGCGARLDETARREMVALGNWRKTAEPKESGLIGFHLPAMISTIGDVTLSTLVAKWLSARARGKESLRVFINTALAEGWEDRGARIEAHTLLSRRESYGEEFEVPQAAVAVTAGVDIQNDYCQMQVQAWGPAAERWVIDWRTIPGNPKLPETRAMLLEALSRKYQHASGAQLPIHATCIDTGFATEEMYDFIHRYQVRRIYGTKGWGGKSGEPIVGKPSERRYGRNPRPIRLYPINTDDAKSEIFSSLSMVAPGPSFLHFPMDVDEEFFSQLCSEHKETVYNKSNVATHFKWVQDRDRNEALDTAVLCLAAYRLLNPNIRQMSDSLTQSLKLQADPPTPKVDAPTGKPVPSQVNQRRVARSTYLG